MTLPTIEIPERPKVFNDAGQDEATDWVLVRRIMGSGCGDCYLPEFKRTIKLGQLWWMPQEEVDARDDWEVVSTQLDHLEEQSDP